MIHTDTILPTIQNITFIIHPYEALICFILFRNMVYSCKDVNGLASVEIFTYTYILLFF